MSHTILILDDELDNVRLIETTFRRHLSDANTIGFVSPLAAADWCAVNEPDLCLIDYKMPGMSGIEFVNHVRRQPFYAGVPMMMITAETGTAIWEQALVSGVSDFFNKPLNISDLVARTRNHLQQRVYQRSKSSRAAANQP